MGVGDVGRRRRDALETLRLRDREDMRNDRLERLVPEVLRVAVFEDVVRQGEDVFDRNLLRDLTPTLELDQATSERALLPIARMLEISA